MGPSRLASIYSGFEVGAIPPLSGLGFDGASEAWGQPTLRGLSGFTAGRLWARSGSDVQRTVQGQSGGGPIRYRLFCSSSQGQIRPELLVRLRAPSSTLRSLASGRTCTHTHITRDPPRRRKSKTNQVGRQFITPDSHGTMPCFSSERFCRDSEDSFVASRMLRRCAYAAFIPIIDLTLQVFRACMSASISTLAFFFCAVKSA